MPASHKGDSLPHDFREIQYQFTRHIRDPQNAPAPEDIEDRRMQIYRDLLFNNIEDFLAKGFPVLRKILSDDKWEAMTRDYFKNHQARTPLFPKMTQEFLQYLNNEREVQSDDYPFMNELAHYEWLELAIAIDTRELDDDKVDRDGNLLSANPVLSPLAWPFVYHYPVHRISPDFLPKQPPQQPSYLVVYRDRQDEVGFLELNPVSARLIEVLQNDTERSGEAILLDIAEQIQHPQPQVVVNGGRDILQGMQEKDIILGSRIN
ncbi:MAG: DUF2063 domain-containing protein [Gammaproteobacteria bacterium]|nr:DUF2063 domain-containing protein [Gammaproteobacteria bacterium]